MNPAQKALLDRLRELIEETPTSGAVNASNRPLHVTRFAQSIESRAEDGEALVKYVQAKVHGAALSSYSALVKAGRPDLTVEAVVADADASWASLFTEADRAAARSRLGTAIEAHRASQEAVEATAVERDQSIAAEVSARRVAKGKRALTPEQEKTMLADRAARRAESN